MQIKKITANNYTEALERVKRELGEDALVLSTRTVHRDHKLREYSGAPKVEITAAVDRSLEPDYQETVTATVKESPQENDMGGHTKNELDPELKSLIKVLLSQTDRARSLGLKEHQLNHFQKLVDSGVNENLVAKLFEKVNATLPESAIENLAEEKGLLIDKMKRLVLCAGETRLDGSGQERIALVGPTGAGKTTTIAKLAAEFALAQDKKVALISLDTYRIGAVDQLRVYGDIMRIPVDVANSAEELQSLLKKHADKDVVLIDTIGKSHKDLVYPSKLKKIFKGIESLETHLVLSVPTQEKVFDEILKQFSEVKIDRLLFTKLDEGVTFGSVFNFALRSHIPLSYFTTGQRVPEDIEEANEEKVIRLIFN